MTGRPLVVGISGASGAIYGVRLLSILHAHSVAVHLVVSAWGRRTVEHETGLTVAELGGLATEVEPNGNQAARISSGSFPTAGMIVAPCSAKTLASIATGMADTLLTRAADVHLKERRRLVLMVRETPLHQVHLENMLTVTRMGAVVLPPVPAFYQRPRTIEELVDYTVLRSLDQLDLGIDFDRDALPRWAGRLMPARGSGREES